MNNKSFFDVVGNTAQFGKKDWAVLLCVPKPGVRSSHCQCRQLQNRTHIRPAVFQLAVSIGADPTKDVEITARVTPQIQNTDYLPPNQGVLLVRPEYGMCWSKYLNIKRAIGDSCYTPLGLESADSKLVLANYAGSQSVQS